MAKWRRRCTLFGALPLAACAAPSPAPAAMAAGTASYGCTEEDAPAFILSLRPAGRRGSELRIQIAEEGPAALPRGAYRLSPLRRQGSGRLVRFARAQLRGEGAAAWLSGEVVVDWLEPGRGAAGAYKLSSPGGRSWSGRFNAGWADGSADCG